MEKNVGSVDIEELKKARQELDQERGIESDPNMYSNYNPDRNNSEEEQSGSAEDSSSLENEFQTENQEESSSLEGESFGALELEQTDDEETNSSLDDIVSEPEKEIDNLQLEEPEDGSIEELSETSTDSSDEDLDSQQDTENQDFSAYDNFSAFEVAESDESVSNDNQEVLVENNDEDDATILENLNESNEEEESLDDDSLEELLDEISPLSDSETESAEENTADEVSEDANVEPENLDEDAEPEISVKEDDDVPDELPGLQAHLVEDNDVSVQNSQTAESTSDNELEIIDNYKKLEKLEDLLNEEEVEESAEEEIGEEPVKYATIEEFNFVDVISTDEFKNSDRLSYVLGKNEKGDVVFGNLRDYYNLVIFGKQNDNVQDLVHSILLSLIVKNAVNEVNFVMCDSKADSKFEIYNKSSYMYFNKLAKTNKEILDTLIEVTKELEERYNLLASVGVKSIEQYNTIAKNDGLKTLPYILTVFSNYSKAIQLSESDRINACLTQILKYGRIVGLYLVVVANAPINAEEINYNLPTRISFKADDKSRSFATLGYAGAEHLPHGGDILCSTVEVDNIMHLKVANISRPEIEVLIENIEE